MKHCLLKNFILAVAAANLASAAAITNFTDMLSISDPTQLGRLNRAGIAQDWVGTETYPGELNTSTSYTYKTYTFSITDTPYLQITFDDVGTSEFVSAYLNTYDPNNKATNWLGDAGSSGNSFGVDPLFFQVIVPTANSLVLVVNNTSGNLSSNSPYTVYIDGFIDTDFTDPAPSAVPEPSTLALGSTALGLLAFARRVKRKSL